MFFALSKILEFIVSPFNWVVFLVIAGILVKTSKWKKRLFISALGMLIFFSNPFIANKVMDMWELEPYSLSSIQKPYDVAVLMGGSLRYYDASTERPVYSHSVDRLIQTVVLYKEGKVRKILLSGGSGLLLNQGEKESVIVLNVLEQSGIPLNDIIVESQSRNTYENALFSTEILKQNFPGSRVLLVTSAFHMRRSLACFRKAGIEPIPYPVDKKALLGTYTPDRLIIPDPSNLIYWDILIHEWLGMITYKIQGYI